ncbi:hypothetical protein KIN20_034918 [Parelaphostrongylus tenuis]|uniref:Uncharacterized protein n=1 Tax=Parelaphostrongylus tenuis TaxID=148309 RepID=A0AAD5WKF1_PARTN|nr:hypothetical protein KIN20_034918 [Parelaphostrongylus tenuis]
MNEEGLSKALRMIRLIADAEYANALLPHWKVCLERERDAPIYTYRCSPLRIIIHLRNDFPCSQLKTQYS